MTFRGDQQGQAAVELVAVLPVLVALFFGLWQVALLGHASWSAAAAARAAARAHALGASTRARPPARTSRAGSSAGCGPCARRTTARP